MAKSIKKLIKEFLGLLLLGLNTILPSKRNEIISIYFHNPAPALFEKIIKHLVRKGYRFVPMNEFNRILETGSYDGKIVIVTFDDGWHSNMKLMDIIRRYEVYLTLFITTSAVEQGNFWFEYIRMRKDLSELQKKKEIVRIKKLPADEYYNVISNLHNGKNIKRSALTKEELFEMSREPHITIGSHSVSHISMPGKPLNILETELSDSKSKIENWTENDVLYFSYPSGDYNEGIKDLVMKCGYKLCFTTDTSSVNPERTDRFLIPRRCINDDAGFFEALAKIYGIWYKIKDS